MNTFKDDLYELLKDEYSEEVIQLLNNKAALEFIEDDYNFLTTLIGARMRMNGVDWQNFKSGGYDPTINNGEPYLGAYSLLEDILSESLGSMQSNFYDKELRNIPLNNKPGERK